MANYIKANNTTALNTSGSWTIAGVPTQADTVQWNSTVTGANTVALGGALNVKGVIITNPGGAVTIGTTAANFAIDLSGIDMSAATRDLTIASPVVLYLINGSSQSWNVASGRTLTISSVLNGTGAYTKNGLGNLVLTANTGGAYTTGPTIAAGTVRIGSAGALGSGTVTMTGGALSSASTTGYTLANALSLNGTMTLGDATNTGALTFSGTTTIAGTTTLTTASAVTLSGQLTGSGTLAKSGGAELALTGPAGAISGTVTVSAGSLRIGNFASGYPNQLETTGVTAAAISNSAVMYICGGLSYNFYSTISGTGDLNVRNSSSSGVAFQGTLSSFTGSMRLYADFIEGTTVTQRIYLPNANQWAFGNFYFLSGAGLTTLSQTLSYGGTTTLTYGGPLFIQPGSGTVTAVYANDSSNGSSITNTNVVWLTSNINATFQVAANNGAISLNNEIRTATGNTGVLSLTKTGTNAATLSGANTFTGNVSVSAGTLNANSVTALGAAGSTAAISVTSGATLSLGAALNYSSPGRTTTISGTGVSTGGALVHAFAGTANVGAISLGAAAYVRGTASGTSTLSSAIANGGFALTAGAASGNTLTLTGGISGLGGLVVGNSASDTGTVAFTTANTYQGNTTLSFGTLSLGNASALGSTGTLVFNGGTLDASTTLTVANALTVSANITFAGTAALTLSSTMALGASRTITTNGSGGALTLSGIVSGATFKLTKAGTNTLKLTNANTYSGGTDIGAGTVQAGNTQALGTTGTVTLTASGATLQTLTTGGQNGKLTVAALTNSAGGTIKIGG